MAGTWSWREWVMNVNNITCGHARLKVPCSFHLARVCFLAQLTEVLPPLPFPAPPLCTALNIYTWKNRTRSTPCNTARTHSKTINLLLSKLRQSLVFASVHCWIFSKAILGRTLWIRVLFQDIAHACVHTSKFGKTSVCTTNSALTCLMCNCSDRTASLML